MFLSTMQELKSEVLHGSYFKDMILQQYKPKGTKEWDGWIHPSSLNWSSAPTSQLNKLLSKRDFSPSLSLKMEVGNIIHNFIQEKCNEFITSNNHTEKHIEIPSILFRGTPDQWGKTKLGNVLFEYKSYSKFETDRSCQKRLDGLEGIEELFKKPEHYRQIYDRSQFKLKTFSEPENSHLTQLFTYIWILGLCKVNIDYGCVIYICKDDLDITEFWYKIEDNRDLVEKARDNYKEVLACVRDFHRQSGTDLSKLLQPKEH